MGTSSVRTLLFDPCGEEQPGFGQHLTYEIKATHDGGVEADPEALLRLCIQSLTAIHGQLQAAGIRPAAVAFDTFWHSFLGVDRAGAPTTPLLHLFDTRSTPQAAELAGRLDAPRVHARTGCRLHPSYWPAKLLWLAQKRPDAFAAAERWMSFGEFLFLRFFGDPVASTSMVSGSGLWLQSANVYDPEILDALPVKPAQLYPPSGMDRAPDQLLAPYRSQWPLLHGVPWFPALGDGACNSLGSGCTTVKEFALMVGTSGAMRAVIQADSVAIPDGLWCYRVDRQRFILGGALSNGGDVYAWGRRTLQLPSPEDTERELLKRPPGAHGLVLLPFFAGERSPYWRADLRAAVTGMDLSTGPIDILQAALESVALRFRQIFDLMSSSLGTPRQVIASGGALLASPAWTRMMPDALGMAVSPCLEPEATSRGAALLALERLGAIPCVAGFAAKLGPPDDPVPGHAKAYADLQAAQSKLFEKLYLQP